MRSLEPAAFFEAIAIESASSRTRGGSRLCAEAGTVAHCSAGNGGGPRVLVAGVVVGFAGPGARRRRQFQDAKSW